MGNLLWLTELGFVSHFGILSDFENLGLSTYLLLGPKGNAEFLAWMALSADQNIETSQLIENVITYSG
jgi:hypothetical protein